MYSRRKFLQLGAAVPFLDTRLLFPAAVPHKQTKSQSQSKIDLRYSRDISVYYAADSDKAAMAFSEWINKSSPRELTRAQFLRAEVLDADEMLEKAEFYHAERKKQLSQIKDNRATTDGPTLGIRRATVEERRAQIKEAERQLTIADERLSKAKAQRQEAMLHFDQDLSRRTTKEVYSLVGASSTGKLKPVPVDYVDIALCSLYTSNEDGDDKPWKKSDTRKDHATLSPTVNYPIPADPPCVKDAKEEEKAVLCDLFVSHAADAFGVCYVRVFEKLSLSVTGKLGVSLRLIDLADAADKGFFGGLISVG